MALPNDQILTVAQMRAAEQSLIDGGESVDSLMLKAGQGAAEWVWRIAERRPVTVLCGPGNNGGDGYVIAESLRARGVPVTLVAPMEPTTDAARNARAAYRGDVVTSHCSVKGAVLVDCLFGSGLVRPLSDGLLATLGALASRHACCIAIDLPSGVASDSGQLLNHGLPEYRLTLGLGAWKYAHWTMPACAGMGERRLVPIGITERSGTVRLLGKPLLAAPSPDAHKYTRGLLGVVGGVMPGAGLLAARAAMHGGAGYVKLLAQAAIPSAPPELVVEFAPLADAVADQRLTALLVGPGLGRDATALRRLETTLARDLPTVLDADALVLLAPALLGGRTGTLVATPHEGELAALCQAFGIAAQSRLERACALAAASRMVIIAKGPDTLIASPQGEALLAPAAPSWLATAGTGDVLAGLVASRLAAGAEPLAAASEAVWLHGEAARRAGPVFTASDLAAQLPRAYGACL